MSAQAGVTPRAASLLDVDPFLSRVLGMRATATLGQDPVLPVLALDRGRWMPPERGPDVAWFAILDGLLLRESGPGVPAVLGPSDLVDPWASGPWSVELPVRLAVLGHEFAHALGPWPAAQERVR